MKSTRGLGGPGRMVAVSAFVGLLVVLTLVAVFSRRQATTPTTTPIDASVQVASKLWPLVFNQTLGISVPLPLGMNPCQPESSKVTIRLAACTEEEATNAVEVRRDESWDALKLTAVFDQAFGQELREAGLTSLGNRGASLDGSLTTIRYHQLSDTVTAAIVRDKQIRDGNSRTVSVLFRRDAPLRDNGADVAVDMIVVPYLSAIRFSGLD